MSYNAVMKKAKLIIGLVLGLVLFFGGAKDVKAKSCVDQAGISSDVTVSDNSLELSLSGGLVGGRGYTVLLNPDNWLPGSWITVDSFTANSSSITRTIGSPAAISPDDGVRKTLHLRYNDGSGEKTCKLESYSLVTDVSCDVLFTQGGKAGCYSADAESPIKVSVSNVTAGGRTYSGKVELETNIAALGRNYDGFGGFSVDIVPNRSKNAFYRVRLAPGGTYKVCSSGNIRIQEDLCTESQFVSTASATVAPQFRVCEQIQEGTDARNDCEVCYGNNTDDPTATGAQGVWTSVGCIPTTSDGIISAFMRIGIGMAGGVALLMILASAFMFATSEGEPKRTSEAKEILTHAIVGLLFIIFSVTLLEFIGVKLFRLPEFGVGI